MTHQTTLPPAPTPPVWATALVLILSDIVLLLALLTVRANRIAFQEVPFISLAFIGLVVAAIALIVLSGWLIRGGWLVQLVNRFPGQMVALAVVVVMSVVVAGSLVPPFAHYAAPFILWTMGLMLAIFAQAFPPLLSIWHLDRILVSVAQAVVGLVVFFFIIEAGLRVGILSFGSETDKANYLYDIQDVIGKYNRFDGQPYVNFGLSPNHPDHNSRGYRGDELQTPKDPCTYRIFAIGGSTTYGVSLKNEETYPAQLEQILHERGYPNVEIVNAGVPQYATYDNLVNFEFRIVYDEPDMILTYEGINDVVTRLVDPTRYTGLNPMRGIWDAGSISQSPFVTVRFFTQRLGLAGAPTALDSILKNVSDVQRCTSSDICTNLNMTPMEVLEANPPIYFEQNLRHLVALSQINDVQVVMSTWAYYPEPSNGSLYMTYPHMQHGVAEHNDITRDLTTELDLPMIDLAEQMPYGAEFWLDGLHMTPAGAQAQATIYADYLISHDLLPEPNAQCPG